MQNTDSRRFKDAAYAAFAEVTKALSSPRRLELLDYLVQRPHAVEELAARTGQPLSSCSQHLQVLKRARLVRTRRSGTAVIYRLAEGVPVLFAELRALATAHNPALAATLDEAVADVPETIDLPALADRLERGSVLLLDVRPHGEFVSAHLPGAVSLPVHELSERIGELPEAELVVATCRGPFCTYAAEAVRTLRAHGRAAVRFEGGVAEWLAAGRELAAGAA